MTLENVNSFQEEVEEEVEELLPDFDPTKGVRIVDDFENGPRILGDIKYIEPTQAEIDRAEEIMAEVLRELEGE